MKVLLASYAFSMYAGNLLHVLLINSNKESHQILLSYHCWVLGNFGPLYNFLRLNCFFRLLLPLVLPSLLFNSFASQMRYTKTAGGIVRKNQPFSFGNPTLRPSFFSTSCLGENGTNLYKVDTCTARFSSWSPDALSGFDKCLNELSPTYS